MLSGEARLKHLPKCRGCGKAYRLESGRDHGVHSTDQLLPLVLTCGHTFCSKCLQDAADREVKSITCLDLTCKHITPLTVQGSVKCLSVDVYIVGLIGLAKNPSITLNMHEVEYVKSAAVATVKPSVRVKSRRRASKCPECQVREVSCTCKQCRVSMCGLCFDRIHSHSNVLKKHQAIPLQDSLLGSAESIDDLDSAVDAALSVDQQPVMICSDHGGRVLEFFCQTDQTLLCSHCMLFTSHKNHQIIPIELHKERTAIRELFSKATNALKYARDSCAVLSGAVQKGQSSAQVTVVRIREHFSRLHAALQARENLLCSQVKHLLQKESEAIEHTKLELQDNMRSLGSILSEARLQASGRGPLVPQDDGTMLTELMDHSLLEDTLKDLDSLSSRPCYASVRVSNASSSLSLSSSAQDACPSFFCELALEPLMSQILSHGVLHGSVIEQIEMLSVTDVPDNSDTASDTSSEASGHAPVDRRRRRADEETSEAASQDESDVSCPSVTLSRGGYLSSGPQSGYVSSTVARSQSDDESDLSTEGARSLNQMTTVHLESRRKKRTEKKNKFSRRIIGKQSGNNQELGRVTHIRSPCCFMINLNRDLTSLQSLTRSIKVYCNSFVSSSSEVPRSVTVGEMVLVKFSGDGEWYRAKVLSVHQTTPITCEVFYIDYGNSEIVTLDRMRNTRAKFLRDPGFAILCSLVDIVPSHSSERWSPQSVKDFARLTRGRTMFVRVYKEDEDISFIDLSGPVTDNLENDGPSSTRDTLVFLDHAVLVTSLNTVRVTDVFSGNRGRRFLKSILPTVGEKIMANISFIISPHNFFVQQVGQESRYLSELSEKLQETYGKKNSADTYQLVNPSKGQVCAARFTDDNRWYRAEIIDLVGLGLVTVRYVDYGNSETLSMWNTRHLLDKFLVVPMQALHCTMADVVPLHENWCEEAMLYLDSLSKSPCYAIIEKLQSDQMSVYIHTEDKLQTANQLMVVKGYARATGPCRYTSQVVSGDVLDQMRLFKSPLASEIKAAAASQEQVVPFRARNRAATPMGEISREQVVEAGPVAPPSDAPVLSESADQSMSLYPLVVVSYVESPGKFYVQQVNALKELSTMMKDLRNSLGSADADDDVLVSVDEGDVCAVWTSLESAGKENNKWFRATVTKPLDSGADIAQIEVELIDYGTTLLVSPSHIRTLDDRFTLLPRAATRCHLGDVTPAGDISKWSRTACELFQSIIAEKVLYATPATVDEPILDSLPVDLFKEIRVQGDALSADKLQYSSVSAELRDRGLALRKRKKATAAAAAGPAIAAATTPLKPATQTANAVTNRSTTSNSSSGMDGRIEPRRKIVENNLYRQLFVPPEEAVRGGSVKQSTSSNAVRVWNGDTDYLPPPVPTTLEIKLAVVCVTDNGSLYGQEVKEDMTVLYDLMNHVQSVYCNSERDDGCDWSVGQPIVAQYKEDGSFYRAKILKTDARRGSVLVRYVDFGNSEWVAEKDLRWDSACLHVPIQSYECVLHDIKPVRVGAGGRWGEGILQTLRSVTVGQMFNAVIKKKPVEGSRLVIDLRTLEDNVDIGEYLCHHGLALRASPDYNLPEDDDEKFDDDDVNNDDDDDDKMDEQSDVTVSSENKTVTDNECRDKTGDTRENSVDSDARVTECEVKSNGDVVGNISQGNDDLIIEEEDDDVIESDDDVVSESDDDHHHVDDLVNHVSRVDNVVSTDCIKSHRVVESVSESPRAMGNELTADLSAGERVSAAVDSKLLEESDVPEKVQENAKVQENSEVKEELEVQKNSERKGESDVQESSEVQKESEVTSDVEITQEIQENVDHESSEVSKCKERVSQNNVNEDKTSDERKESAKLECDASLNTDNRDTDLRLKAKPVLSSNNATFGLEDKPTLSSDSKDSAVESEEKTVTSSCNGGTSLEQEAKPVLSSNDNDVELEDEPILNCDKTDAHIDNSTPQIRQFTTLPALKPGDSHLVTVTHVDTSGLVFIQRTIVDDSNDPEVIESNTRLDSLLQICNSYQDDISTLEPLGEGELREGMPCVAQYSADDCWYRAVLVRVSHDGSGRLICDILFVDYGSRDVITSTEHLCQIPDAHLALPKMAVPCRLNKLTPTPHNTSARGADPQSPGADSSVEGGVEGLSADQVQSICALVSEQLLVAIVEEVNGGIPLISLYSEPVYRSANDKSTVPLIYQSIILSSSQSLVLLLKYFIFKLLSVTHYNITKVIEYLALLAESGRYINTHAIQTRAIRGGSTCKIELGRYGRTVGLHVS